MNMNTRAKTTRWTLYLLLGILGTITVIKAAASQIDRTLEELKIITEVFDNIQSYYVEEKSTKDLVYGAARGMVRTLDPFSQFLEPKHHQEMRIETEGQFGGLGIRIHIANDWLTVQTPLPDTPAYRAGILPGDRIVKIEGKSTQGITLIDAVEKLRGKPGTTVTITIVHEKSQEPLDVMITREIIKIRSVRSRMIEKGIGYIQLKEFTAKTNQDMAKALKRLTDEGMEGLVLDLRNNPGGLLKAAHNVTKNFLDNERIIVYTEGRTSERVDYKSDAQAPFSEVPMVVMVNRGSASGSEIVAGALQDHKRALILGTTTFGKASVQSVLTLTGGAALRLTTAKYYTPLGRSIQHDEKSGKGGIVPDIVIPIPREVEIKIRRQQEEIYTKDKPPRSAVKEEDQAEDIVLKRAVEYLKAGKILHRNQTVQQSP